MILLTTYEINKAPMDGCCNKNKINQNAIPLM